MKGGDIYGEEKKEKRTEEEKKKFFPAHFSGLGSLQRSFSARKKLVSQNREKSMGKNADLVELAKGKTLVLPLLFRRWNS